MVRVWLSVNLKRHGVDCGGIVGRIGSWTRADRSQTWPHLGHNLHTGGKPSTLCASRAGKVSGYRAWLRGGYSPGPGRCHDRSSGDSRGGITVSCLPKVHRGQPAPPAEQRDHEMPEVRYRSGVRPAPQHDGDRKGLVGAAGPSNFSVVRGSSPALPFPRTSARSSTPRPVTPREAVLMGPLYRPRRADLHRGQR
jgi:hypothetical protein